MEPSREFARNRGMQVIAFVLLAAEVVLVAAIFWYFAESRAGTWGDLGGAAMNLVFGIPLGVAGLIAGYFARLKHPALATGLIILSLALALQVPTLLGAKLIKNTAPRDLQDLSRVPVREVYEIRETDIGKIFVYSVTSRFTAILDERAHPESAFSVDCDGEDAIGAISNVPAVATGSYSKRFEAVRPGSCILSDGDWRVEVRIEAQRTG